VLEILGHLFHTLSPSVVTSDLAPPLYTSSNMRSHQTVLVEYIVTLNPAGPATAKSYVFNIFPANYWPQRFYAGGPDILEANHREIKDLGAKSGKKFDPGSNDLQARPPFGERRPRP
jgi:hypothetical protein